MAALSFCYAPPISGQYTQYVTEDEDAVLTTLKDTCQTVMDSRACQISVLSTKSKTTPLSSANIVEYNLSLTGSEQALMKARGDLLQNCPLEIKLTLQIPPNTKLSLLNDQFKNLEKELNTKIKVTPEKTGFSSLESDNPVYIQIVGNPIQVEECRVRVLVLLDEMKSFKTEIVRLPLKLQYLICGRKRAGLLPIIEETSTNIYFPSPFANINNTKKAIKENEESGEKSQAEDEIQPAIYITGEPNHVSRVKDMLNKLAVQKAKSMYHKDTALYARKMDWLLLHRRDELRKIMHDNGAYIEFPPLGSGDNRVTIYAENRVNAERTLRALNFQACNIYEACFYFNNNDGQVYDSNGSHTFFDSTSNLSSLVSQLSQVSGSEVIYKTETGCIEVLGAERAIRNVYQRLQEMQFIQVFHQCTVFRVESSNEQRDFISGKKNGKINKIMKTSGAKIRFMPFINDYNFIIEVESTSFTKALDGLTLLQEELPAEISFYVPESYHKRIIGVGGKNIQRIMKKYGVYVKFSNTEEFASLGGYYNNEDNVVARTPMKNQINLDNLRHAVMELIHPKDRNYVTETIQIPFDLHRDMIHEYQDDFIADELIKKANTHVLWPDAELATNNVDLLGPEDHMQLAFKLMEGIIPEAFDFHVPYSTAYSNAVQTDAFHEKVITYLHQKSSVVIEILSSFEEKPANDEDGIIRISMTRDKIAFGLRESLETIISFLKDENVKLYDNTTVDELVSKVQNSQHLLHSISNPSSNNTLLETSSVLKHQPSQSTLGHSSVSMMRSSNDSIYTTASNSNKQTNPSPPQAYQFFNFNSPNDTNTTNDINLNTTPNIITNNNSHANSNNNNHISDNWNSLHQGHIPSNPKPVKTSGSDNNLRAIFDAPMDLTDQERVVLSNYRYQRMSMPPSTKFGFPQTVVPTGAPSTGSDIWSTPTNQIPAVSNRRPTSGFATSSLSSSPQNSRRNTGSYPVNASNDNTQIRMFHEGGKSFYRHVGHGHEFNPYNDNTTSSSAVQNSGSDSLLESHFNPGGRTSSSNFPTSPNTFSNQGFSQFGNFSRPPAGFTSPSNHTGNQLQQQQQQQQQQHQQQPRPAQFFQNNDEANVVHSILDNFSSGFDQRRQQPSDQENKGNSNARPPPGIDI